MPELPEVEALRLGLVSRIVGSKILEVEVRQEKIIAGKGTTRKGDSKNTKYFIDSLVGKKIVGIDRRAKNLIFNLKDFAGEGAGKLSSSGEINSPFTPPEDNFSAPSQKETKKPILLAHLKMTGQFVFVPHNKKEKISFGGHPIEESENFGLPHKHTYIIFKLDNGTLYYNDVRQFGYVLYFDDKKVLEEENHFENIGLEPFDKNFTLKYFRESLKAQKTSAPIKKILLDQKIVVGVGNIYCDEVFWASSVLPIRTAKSLKDIEIEKIYKNIIKILDKAIKSGGSSVANYLLADGKRGNFADYHNAYQKTGNKCKFPGCKGTIEKITLVGRGTHFCPKHQK